MGRHDAQRSNNDALPDERFDPEAANPVFLSSFPPNEGVDEVVIFPDDRVYISDPRRFPWRAICSLNILAADGTSWVGTGWFVSPRTIITAGHCVFLHDNRGPDGSGWARSIEVVPGRDASQKPGQDAGPEPYASATATDLRTVSAWIDGRERSADYGAIILPEGSQLGSEVGWFRFANLGDGAIQGKTVNISGYPGTPPEGGTRGTQWWHGGPIKQLDDDVIYYKNDTSGGQSGAPVWMLSASGERTVIGIHTNGHISGNSATRINSSVYDNLNNWRIAGS